MDVLGLRIPAELDERYRLRERIPAAERPVVFIGPYEHHSNELPWRESIADVVTIHEDAEGHIDLAHLEQELVRYADRPLRIGSFSAASNVTGILSDTRADLACCCIATVRSAFWDFAAAAPYVDIQMEPHRPRRTGRRRRGPRRQGRGVHLAPQAHRRPGHARHAGGAPGAVPQPGAHGRRRRHGGVREPAGATATWPTPEHREEAGTPDIMGSIRAGLVFQLKERRRARTPSREREESFIRRAIERWERVPGIQILGDHRARRLSIVSFTVRHGGRYLHHNLVVAMLNDLFGIQSRGGCSCAGPYGHRLLGIDLETSHR